MPLVILTKLGLKAKSPVTLAIIFIIYTEATVDKGFNIF